jgi:polar amino acid transport system substrate-binding protein
MRASRAALAALVLVAVLPLSSGCLGKVSEQKLTPKVAPPVIVKAGELRAAIDTDYPPYGGSQDGRNAGLDVDVAAALADRLGLKLVIVQATPIEAFKLVRDGKVDVVFGGLTIEDAVSNDLAFAGAYSDTAPALFSSKPGTLTIEKLGGAPVAVQKGSAAFWILDEQYGSELLRIYPTLKEAMTAVSSGQAAYVAGDAAVGSYMLRDFGNLHFAGQLADATPVGVGVSRDKPQLENAVRSALDGLAADGALPTLLNKWLGDMPKLEGSSETSATP